MLFIINICFIDRVNPNISIVMVRQMMMKSQENVEKDLLRKSKKSRFFISSLFIFMQDSI